jgi:hypothetical protein
MSPKGLKFFDGKVFVGYDPRSKRARMFSALVLLTGLLLGLAGMLMLSGMLGDIPGRPPFAERPEDDAPIMLARADELAAAGKLADSARLDQAVALGFGAAETVDAAVQRVKSLLARSAAEDDVAEQAVVLKVAVSLERAGVWYGPNLARRSSAGARA